MEIKIAIVEDNDIFRIVLERLCDDTPDFNCIGSYDNAEEALEMIQVNNAPHIVLVDVMMPGMDGIELVSQLYPKLPDTRFLFISSINEYSTVIEALEQGASGYVFKLASYDVIIRSIREVADGGAALCSNITRLMINSFQGKKEEYAAFPLTQREREVLDLLSKGLLYKEIAAALHISADTVRKHCSNIYDKLDVHNKTEAINKFFPRR